MNVKEIPSKDVLYIRSQVLRSNQSSDKCIFQGDKEESTFHLGAFSDNKLVSVASFYFGKSEHFSEKHQYRLRGMATLKEHQGKGYGKALIKTALPVIKRNQCDLLWCNARTTAMGFYESIGFSTESEEFSIDGVGPHRRMKLIID